MNVACTLNLADYVTHEELAAFLGVQKDTLKKWRCDGKGPSHVKFGRRTLYPKADVLDWIEMQRRRTERSILASRPHHCQMARQAEQQYLGASVKGGK